MVRAFSLSKKLAPASIAAACLISGCQIAPRERLEECHRLSQTLRSENARLKDQVLALRSQNEDYSERAVDDARRLALLEESNQFLEQSVQSYQAERDRLESAFNELRANLPQASRAELGNHVSILEAADRRDSASVSKGTEPADSRREDSLTELPPAAETREIETESGKPRRHGGKSPIVKEEQTRRVGWTPSDTRESATPRRSTERSGP